MVAYLSWGANVILFVTACFLAANTANAIFAAILTPPTRAVVEREGSAPVAAPSWAQRQVILDRNLFHSSTVENLAGRVEPIEEVEPTRLPLDLLGTAAAADPQLAWAAVLDRETRETLIVGIDDVLKEKATVARIERRRVLLLENGTHRELTFGDEPPAEKPVRRAKAPGRAPNARRSGLTRVNIPRRDMENALKNPGDLLSQARFLPKQEDGELIGIEVGAIKPGSVLQDVGLKNGDLITEFNGIPIDSPEDSGRLIQELGDAEEITLEVEDKDGVSQTIVVRPSG
jgi:general secretion pathway protein C